MSSAADPIARPDAGLEIRIMGPLEVRVDGAPIVVDTRKALAILALLAVDGRPFGRDELAALLWPESDDASARAALRRTLSVLRTALGDRWLRVDRGSVALDRTDVWVDIDALDRPGPQGAALLRLAAEQQRGPFLAGFSLRDSPDFDDWRASRASMVERSVGALLDRLADAAGAEGDLAGAVAAASRRVDLDPLDESAHRRLMTALARTGERAQAIRQYRACVAVLQRELDVTPLAETTALYEAIRDAAGGVPSFPIAITPPLPSRPAVSATVLPFVGRDTELAALIRTHLSSTPAGRLALVTGEAGIGKSRLIDALHDAIASHGGRTLVVRAYPTEGGIAYGSILALLRLGLASSGAADRLAALPSGALAELERLIALPAEVTHRIERQRTKGTVESPAQQARLLDAVTTALAALTAGPVPGLIAIEDLQWADHASREALLWLARRLEARQMTVVVSWRPEDLDDLGMAFAAAAESIAGVTIVRLDRLDRDAVRELATAAATAGMAKVDADRLFEESEGLPLFIAEALAVGTEGEAEGALRNVRTLLRERLGRLSETAAQILAAAAVIGRSFDVPLLRSTSGRTEEETITALEELVRRAIVRERALHADSTFDFVHARLREAAYDAISLARRRLLHRRAAAQLEALATSRDPSRLVQLATHQRAAGLDTEAARTFRDAGLAARAVYANREAAAHLETALALGHPALSEIQLALGDVRTAQGDYTGAIAALEAAAAVIDEADLPAVEVRLGLVHSRRGDLAAAASHLDAAIAALEQRPAGTTAQSQQLLVRALVERAITAERTRDLDRAGANARQALAIADAASDDAGSGAAHRVLGLVARDRGDLDAARSSLERSLILADSDPDAGTAIAARNALALVEATAGNRNRAIALLETALEACRRTGERHLEAAIENNLADQLHAAGREAEAMEHLKHAVAAFADVGTPGELEPEIWKLITW